MGWQIDTMNCGIKANIVRMKGLLILLLANQVELIQIKTSPMASDSTICITKDGIKERKEIADTTLISNKIKSWWSSSTY
jgi:hydrogenase maturation factor HypF (carbamoyltransferase family)